MLGRPELEPILAAVIQSSLDCIIVIDEQGRVLEFNPAAEETFEYSRSETLGRPIAELIVPEHLRQKHEQGLAAYVAGAPAKLVGRRVNTQGCSKSGRIFPVELTITEVHAPGRRVFTASLRDLSPGWDKEEELTRTRRSLELAVEGAKLGIWTLDMADGSAWFSDRSREIYGLAPDVPIDFGLFKRILHPDDWEKAAKPYFDGFPVDPLEAEYRIIRPDGEMRWIYALGSAVRDSKGVARSVHGIHLDMTERKLADEELSEARRHLELSVEGAKIGIWSVDPRTGETWYSDRSRELWGVGKELHIDARTLKSYIHPEDWPIILQTYRDGFPGDTIAHEIRVLWLNGETRWVQSLGRALRDEKGEVFLVSGIHIDITDRKRAEEEIARSREALHQSEKLTAMGSLLAGVSHELNNPLAAIVGQAEMLEEDSRGTPMEERARRISSAAERCSRIVQTFLAMARQREPKRSQVNVNDIVVAALEITEYGLRTAGVSVQANFGNNLPQVDADRDQLNQVLVNLIVNAQQAMEKSETFNKILAIETSLDQSGQVLIDLKDSGPGIPPDVLNRIFEPFFTTKPVGSGTGVGLSFSQGIIEAHGGSLTVEPSIRGAHFRIAMPPAALPELTIERLDAAPASVRPARLRVLVAEDEPDVGQTLRELLEREGLEVTLVTDGAEALVALDRSEYDILLSDLKMPGFSGSDLYQRISETRPHLLEKMGFITGDTLGQSVTNFIAECGRPILEKPFTRAGVRGMLSFLLSEKGPR